MSRTTLVRAGLACALVALAAGGASLLRSDTAVSAVSCPTGFKLVAQAEAGEKRAGIREQESLDVEVFADDGPAIPRLPASVLYRIAQESLRNAVRHAQARRVELWLRRGPGTATLEVVDDGRGFDVKRAEERRPGMGLFSMRERVGLVNGTLALVSAPGRGTRVVATVPLTETPDKERS